MDLLTISLSLVFACYPSFTKQSSEFQFPRVSAVMDVIISRLLAARMCVFFVVQLRSSQK